QFPHRPEHAPALGLRADGCHFHCNADHLERRWIMNSRFRKLAVESLEGRSVLSTVPVVVEAYFNNDTLMDRAELTGPNTIEVSLANPDGTYTLSAILTTPKTLPMKGFSVFDADQDGDMDIGSSTPKGGDWELHQWLNNGDGPFGSLTTTRWKPSRWWV